METKEIIETLKHYIEEIGGDLVETTGSHKGIMSLWITDEQGNSYQVKEIQPILRIGCGCWDGIDITIMKEQKPND